MLNLRPTKCIFIVDKETIESMNVVVVIAVAVAIAVALAVALTVDSYFYGISLTVSGQDGITHNTFSNLFSRMFCR